MLKYLALGDSYTIGESVPEKDRWPNQLARMFEKSREIRFDAPKIIAKTGWTTSELQKGIQDAKLGDAQFDLVTLLIGVNNQYRGQDFELYETEYVQLVEQAIRFARNDAQHLIGVSIPDYGITPFAAERNLDAGYIGKELDKYNAFAKKTLEEVGATWVDITAASRKQSSQTGMLADDGLHPSGAMYKTWAEKVAPAVKKSLS